MKIKNKLALHTGQQWTDTSTLSLRAGDACSGTSVHVTILGHISTMYVWNTWHTWQWPTSVDRFGLKRQDFLGAIKGFLVKTTHHLILFDSIHSNFNYQPDTIISTQSSLLKAQVPDYNVGKRKTILFKIIKSGNVNDSSEIKECIGSDKCSLLYYVKYRLFFEYRFWNWFERCESLYVCMYICMYVFWISF
jgi:hypothetical protein